MSQEPFIVVEHAEMLQYAAEVVAAKPVRAFRGEYNGSPRSKNAQYADQPCDRLVICGIQRVACTGSDDNIERFLHASHAMAFGEFA